MECFTAGFNGTTPGFAGKSCKTIKFISYLNANDGQYWIDPTNSGSPFQVICDMTTDGGIAEIYNFEISKFLCSWNSCYKKYFHPRYFID